MLGDLSSIQDGIRNGRFTNEASVSTGIVLRLLNALSWPVYDPDIVCPEYPLNGRRVDFALCSTQKEPLIFIEVKQVGLIQKGDQQLFEYAFLKGVPMAILTDGREWHFYLPGERGNFYERRAYLLDILERDLAESANRLQRYLDYQGVRSGAALEAARTDYRDAAKERLVQATLPEAWEKLVEDKDELLIELISDKVETLCGYKPNLNTVIGFLTQYVLPNAHRNMIQPIQILSPATDQPALQKTQNPPVPRITAVEQPASLQTGQFRSGFGFSLQGKEYSATSSKDMLVKIFGQLTQRDASFPERFASLHQGRTRRYIAQQREGLNPGRPDLAKQYSREFAPGWWIDINISIEMIEKIVRKASEIAGIK